jgi:single-strand DNA-binding protein
VWGRRAEVCGEYLSKGSPVFVEGRLQSRNWESQDGQKRSTIEVVADNVQFLRGAAAAGKPAEAGKAVVPPEEVETINLNEDLGPLPEEGNTKSGNKDSGEEAPF